MRSTRRALFAAILRGAGAMAAVVVIPRRATACLLGTWFVKCPYDGQIDRVDDGTCQHVCSRDRKQVFNGSTVTVMCPSGHPNTVDTGDLLRSLKCSVCGEECRRTDLEKKPPQNRDRGGR